MMVVLVVPEVMTIRSGRLSATQISVVAVLNKNFETGATKGGTDTVAGKRCQVYSIPTTEICLADDLPLRIVITSGTTKTTIVFTSFDNVDIKAPI